MTYWDKRLLEIELSKDTFDRDSLVFFYSLMLAVEGGSGYPSDISDVFLFAKAREKYQRILSYDYKKGKTPEGLYIIGKILEIFGFYIPEAEGVADNFLKEAERLDPGNKFIDSIKSRRKVKCDNNTLICRDSLVLEHFNLQAVDNM